jgi:hypothetical protein
MPNNKAISVELLETLYELQELPSLQTFAIAGGSCLALRYGHRKSIDIDLFSPDLIGIAGLKKICEETEAFFGKENILSIQLINDENGDGGWDTNGHCKRPWFTQVDQPVFTSGKKGRL